MSIDQKREKEYINLISSQESSQNIYKTLRNMIDQDEINFDRVGLKQMTKKEKVH